MLCGVAQLCSWWEEHHVAGRMQNRLIHCAHSAALASQLPQWLFAASINHITIEHEWKSVCMCVHARACVHVCVCVREREREKLGSGTYIHIHTTVHSYSERGLHKARHSMVKLHISCIGLYLSQLTLLAAYPLSILFNIENGGSEFLNTWGHVVG
jgi:hypothetical protein